MVVCSSKWLPLAVLNLMLLYCGRRSPVCDRFFEVPLDQQATLIRQYGPDEQLELYLCSKRHWPPAMNLDDPLSSYGRPMAVAIVDRLSQENNVDKEYLVELLATMARQSWNIASDPKLWNKLRQRISVVNDPEARANIEKYLTDMQAIHAKRSSSDRA